MGITVALEEGERQAVLLALAELSLARPGWVPFLEGIAMKMDNHLEGKAEMFEAFRHNYSNTVYERLSS